MAAVEGRRGEILTPGMRVGLLGGSFNPAHAGHLHLSLIARARIGLDRVWWLVSPQNPLKPAAGMAPFAARLASARAIAGGHPAIVVTDIEARLGTRYTAETLRALRARHPGVRFVWLMGADNLAQLPRWRDWTWIMEHIPVAVIDRPGSGRGALRGLAATRYARYRLPAQAARSLPERKPPAWLFLRERLHPASATAIRARGGFPAARDAAEIEAAEAGQAAKHRRGS